MRNHLIIEFQFNDFLLQRTLTRKFQISTQELLRLAREILKLALEIVDNQNNMQQFTYDLSWVVSKELV